MAMSRPVGQGAQARKYDILSALGAHGLAGGQHRQRLALRLITLITARYNWGHDHLAVGQAEIARLWAVDERTVKREMARLREMGWLRLKRPGARGRVNEYGIDLERILDETRDSRAAIGPDFERRLAATEPVPAGTEGVNVIPFPQPEPFLPESDDWKAVCAAFEDDDPAAHRAWIAPLLAEGIDDGHFVLRAPTRFHASYVRIHFGDRLERLLRRRYPELSAIVVLALGEPR